MTDPLSIAASVSGLIAIGLHISHTVAQAINDTRSAPDAIKFLSFQLSSFCKALGDFSTLLESKLLDSSLGFPASELSGLLENIMCDFKGLQTILNEYQAKPADGVIRQQWKKLLWTFQENNVGGLAKNIEAYKATLILTMSFATVPGISHITKTTEQVRDELQRVRSLCQHLRGRGRASSITSLWTVIAFRNSSSTSNKTAASSYRAASFIDYYCDRIESLCTIRPEPVEVTGDGRSGDADEIISLLRSLTTLSTRGSRGLLDISPPMELPSEFIDNRVPLPPSNHSTQGLLYPGVGSNDRAIGYLLAILLPLESAQIGRLVLDPKNPHQDYIKPLERPTTLKSFQRGFSETRKLSRSSKLGSYIRSSISISYGQSAYVTLSAEVSKVHRIKDPILWFDNAMSELRVHQYLQQAAENGSNIYLIVGSRAVEDVVSSAGITSLGTKITFTDKLTEGRVYAISYRKVNIKLSPRGEIDSVFLGGVAQWAYCLDRK